MTSRTLEEAILISALNGDLPSVAEAVAGMLPTEKRELAEALNHILFELGEK